MMVIYLYYSNEVQAVSEILPQWVEDMKGSYVNDLWIQALQTKIELARATSTLSKFTEFASIVRYKNKICVGS
jgi:hypothetical protein